MQTWGIHRIVLHGRTHQASYQYLKERHPGVKLQILPDALFPKTIQSLILLLRIKLSGQTLFFFHECCCPIFDLLVKLIKPNGHHYPQVTLQSFESIPESSMPATRMHKALRMLQLHRFFNYYRGEADNGDGYFFVQSLKEYPENIQAHCIDSSRKLLKCKQPSFEDLDATNRVLLLCGRDIHSDHTVDALYRSVVDLAIKHGYECDIKDHPAEFARLNFKDDRGSVIDPAIPLELIPDKYALVVGMGSTGLLHFSEKGVSMLHIPSGASASSIARRVAHLCSLPGGQSIKFPGCLEELDAIFAQSKVFFRK